MLFVMFFMWSFSFFTSILGRGKEVNEWQKGGKNVDRWIPSEELFLLRAF